MSTSAPDVVVIGGGIAGLSVAARLARDGRVRLYEREPLLAAHASGRNAAIYRPLEHDATSAELAFASRDLLLRECQHPVLDARGLVLADVDAARVRAEAERAQALGVACEVLCTAALHDRVPALAGGQVLAGLLLPEGGVLDIHEILSTLERSARRAGARIELGRGIAAIEVEGGRVTGVRLEDGGRTACEHVVIAAGAWAATLSASARLPAPLQPVRRHLVQLSGASVGLADGPVVWRQDQEVYFRREGDGLLCSPCDAVPWPPGSPPSDAQALELLANKLQATAPGLAGLGVRSAWACLRTFAPDSQLVLGPDPRLRGLHWIAGLGGKGMSVAPAAGERVARTLLGESHLLPPSLAADRMFS